MHVYAAKLRARQAVGSKTALWFGANATTASITAACHFGWNRTIAALCANKNGASNEWANNNLFWLAVFCSVFVLKLIIYIIYWKQVFYLSYITTFKDYILMFN